ncbi:MAG: prolyl oligopeptidase family serine peptidase [Alphaproteobacteria bacterium]|nr:prolyl oligopeptidase family serine peptidase [Alphaproteobacteria bacterium]
MGVPSTGMLDRRRALRLLAAAGLFTATAASAWAQAGPAGQPRGEWRQQTYLIPLPHDGNRGMHTLVLRPPGEDRHPLVVINHGSPANPSQRPSMKPGFRTAATWFVRRGYVVALPMRRGYGETGGSWDESYGKCGSPDYRRAGLETAKDIATAVDYMTALPFVEAERAIVVGQSAGGWGAIALASLNPPKVAAIVNFAGGRGGYADNRPNNNCTPDRLVQAAGEYGRTARLPMLWLYTENDLFFDPTLSRRMAEAFTAAGGKAEYKLLPAFGTDGHLMFGSADGLERWEQPVAAFLTANGR